MSITFLAVILCLASPVVAVLAGESIVSISRIYRYSDGASIGVYLNDKTHDTVGSRLVIRRRGFAIDGELVLEPIGLVFAVIPPVLWVFCNHYRPMSRHLWLLPLCAACPFALTLMMVYVRRLDELSFAAGMLCFGGAATVAIAKALRRRKRKRIEKGLCPNCAYDVRATPDAGGPVLPRCPECGSPSNADSITRVNEQLG